MPRGSKTAVNRPIQHHRKTVTSRSLSTLPQREVCPRARSVVTAGIRKSPPVRTARVPQPATGPLTWSVRDRGRRDGPRSCFSGKDTKKGGEAETQRARRAGRLLESQPFTNSAT